MVAIKAATINRLITKGGDYHAYLFFGHDEGLVSERARTLSKTLASKTKSGAEEIRLLEDELQASPERLSLDLKTISMFGERKIIRVSGVKNFPHAEFKDLLLEAPFEADLIIEAGDLKKSDRLRKLFETEKTLAAIACYHDKRADLNQLIEEISNRNKLTISSEARDYLSARLGADRALSRGELEKLAIYAASEGEITISHIDDILTDMSEITLDNIIAATLKGETTKAVHEWRRASAEGTAPTAVFLMLLRQLEKLYHAATEVARGVTIHAVAKAQRPPLYFERRDNFVIALNLWREDDLAKAITRTEQIMARSRSRSNPGLEEKELIALLLALATFARKKGKS